MVSRLPRHGLDSEHIPSNRPHRTHHKAIFGCDNVESTVRYEQIGGRGRRHFSRTPGLQVKTGTTDLIDRFWPLPPYVQSAKQKCPGHDEASNSEYADTIDPECGPVGFPPEVEPTPDALRPHLDGWSPYDLEREYRRR